MGQNTFGSTLCDSAISYKFQFLSLFISVTTTGQEAMESLNQKQKHFHCPVDKRNPFQILLTLNYKTTLLII